MFIQVYFNLVTNLINSISFNQNVERSFKHGTLSHFIGTKRPYNSSNGLIKLSDVLLISYKFQKIFACMNSYEVLLTNNCNTGKSEFSRRQRNLCKKINPLTDTIAVDSDHMLMIAISAMSLSHGEGCEKSPKKPIFFSTAHNKCDQLKPLYFVL